MYMIRRRRGQTERLGARRVTDEAGRGGGSQGGSSREEQERLAGREAGAQLL